MSLNLHLETRLVPGPSQSDHFQRGGLVARRVRQPGHAVSRNWNTLPRKFTLPQRLRYGRRFSAETGKSESVSLS